MKHKHIESAYNYLNNANKLLRENCTIDENGHYDKRKYVKMAGHTAYLSIFEALKPIIKYKNREKIEDIRAYFGKRDKKMLKVINTAYEVLHLHMGYDGTLATATKKLGWKQAKMIIEWAESNTPKAQQLAGTKAKAKKSSPKRKKAKA